jgi:ferredoxin-thioredoxin reductase catalytic subunit
LTTLEQVRKRAENDAKNYGYYLTPDQQLLKDLLEGLVKNIERYGYGSCPCRLASGNFELDRDILCPCDYRDPDVTEFGYCYCALYVRKDVYEGKTPIQPIPERRPTEKQARAYTVPSKSEVSDEESTKKTEEEPVKSSDIKMKLWFCGQCGYVCFREDPPYVCPLCKAKRDMFSEVTVTAEIRGKNRKKS